MKFLGFNNRILPRTKHRISLFMRGQFVIVPAVLRDPNDGNVLIAPTGEAWVELKRVKADG